MPVCVEYPEAAANVRSCRSVGVFSEDDERHLDIGLINNMSGPALQATERQFCTLLESAAEGIVVRLSFLAFSEVQRSAEVRRRVDNFYHRIDGVPAKHLDGMIVTGAEPVTADLMQESCWHALTRVLDWAEHNTRSSVWSCLAAHAAVLQLDGIRRRRLSEKLSGVFECVRVSDSPVIAGFPPRAWMPHSRWNDVPERSLRASGYEVLTRSGKAGVDLFAKRSKSLLLFFQGHPEYESCSLLLEYRRDVGRFLRGETAGYPAVPQVGLDRGTAAALCLFRERAMCDRRQELLADFPVALLAAGAGNTWRPAAISVYRNWLLYLCAQKAAWLRSRQGQRLRAAAG